MCLSEKIDANSVLYVIIGMHVRAAVSEDVSMGVGYGSESGHEM